MYNTVHNVVAIGRKGGKPEDPWTADEAGGRWCVLGCVVAKEPGRARHLLFFLSILFCLVFDMASLGQKTCLGANVRVLWWT